MAVPFWYRLAIWLGKRQAWLFGMGMLALVFLFTGFLRPSNADPVQLFALSMANSFAAGSLSVIAGPMLCDVIDFGRYKSGVERTGVYFSVHSLMTKLQVAIGGAIGMTIAATFGFTVGAASYDGLPLTGLLIGVSWGPVLFVVLAMVFIAFMPLDERRMVIVRKRLEQRAERANRASRADQPTIERRNAQVFSPDGQAMPLAHR